MNSCAFDFKGCIEIRELLGKKANDEQKLLEYLEEVPVDSIYYHTHSYFLRHFFIAGPYPNDFANWAAIQVRDRVLGEKLGVVTPSSNKTLEDIRLDLIDIVDGHLSETKYIPFAMYGQPFHFMTSKIIEIPTGLSANTLDEFADILEKVDASAIYNHIFEARMRGNKGRTDFSIWFEDILGKHELAEKLEMLDSYMFSLENLRLKILDLCKAELAHEEK